jgi:mono/diheme cytochrome c family protein
MKKILNSILLITLTGAVVSCGGPKRKPGKTYMPDMAYSRAYESYPNLDPEVFTDADSAAGAKIYYDRKPVPGAVKRGQMGVYHGSNDSVGIQASTGNTNPLSDSMMTPALKTESQRLFLIYCAICHGEKLDGNGPLWTAAKLSGMPANLMDQTKFGRSIYSDGRVFHSITYGKNLMGGYASQLNNKQRWMVVNYIRSKQDEAAKKAPAAPAVGTKTATTKDTGKVAAATPLMKTK